MSLTPERRVTPPGTYGLSIHSLVNTIDRSVDIPSLRVEAAEIGRSSSSLSTTSQISMSSSKGNVLDNVYSPIATFLVKTGVGFMVAMSLIVLLFGDDLIVYMSQIFGFILIFLMVFAVSCGGYLWWMSWVHEAVNLNIRSTVMLLVTCVSSEVISSLVGRMVDVGKFESLPIDLSFYTVHTVTLFCLFAGLVHQKGTSAIFAHETCIFVSLTVVMHYASASVFSKVLPSFLCCQIVYGSCLLAMCISLVLLKNQPSISLIAVKRLIRTSMHSKKDAMPASYAGRRYSNVSLMSNGSSIRPKNSITDQSSFSGYHDIVDTEGLTEATGMIGDLLFQEDRLTQKGKESLRKIQQLLTLKSPSGSGVQYIPRSRLNSGESDVTSASASSYIVNTPRRVSFSQKRNQSSQFTTTTTSTGLPNIERDPQERKRSQASRDRPRMSLVEGGRPSVHRFSSPLTRQYKKSLPNLSTSSLQYSSDYVDSNASSEISLTSADSSGPPSEDDAIRRLNSRSDSLDVISEDEEGGAKPPGAATPLPRPSSDTETDVLKANSEKVIRPSQKNSFFFNNFSDPPVVSVEVFRNNQLDLLSQVYEWDFPIFEMEKLSNGSILSQMAFCLFKDAGLMETFSIPQQEFINYFRLMETNYGSNTYHNRTHAADVLHATSYLLFEEIPEFSYDTLDSGTVVTRPWIGNLRSKVMSGNIASAFSILEVLACYLAAAMHDFDHPGRTNAFLVATKSPLAILYNDRSVLENHHIAASWDLLVSDPKRNFLVNLESTELKRLRFLIIECILATDLKQHFEIVRDFREKFDAETTGGIDWTDDMDRLLVMKMVIKMADINTPTKSLELHRSWTARITEEFYQQHEDEMRLKLPQTIFMHRHETEKLPAIQVSFIQNLVAPLFRACAEIGIIPGVAEPVVSTSKGEGLSDEDLESDSVLEDDDSIPDEADALIRPAKKIFSIILTNLQMNFEAWNSELPPKETTLPDEDSDMTSDEDD